MPPRADGGEVGKDRSWRCLIPRALFCCFYLLCGYLRAPHGKPSDSEFQDFADVFRVLSESRLAGPVDFSGPLASEEEDDLGLSLVSPQYQRGGPSGG